MEIYKAKIKDIPRISELALDLARYHEKIDSYIAFTENAKKEFQNLYRKCIYSKNKMLLVAADSNRIIGFALATFTEKPVIWKMKKYGFIHDVYLEKNYRGRGIAKSFLENFYAWFKKYGIKDVELTVLTENKLGRKAWKKYGYKEYLIRARKKI